MAHDTSVHGSRFDMSTEKQTVSFRLSLFIKTIKITTYLRLLFPSLLVMMLDVCLLASVSI